RAVRDPHLGAVEDPAARRVGLRVRDNPARVASEVGLGETEAADRFAACEPREPLLLLLLGPERVDREHHERALHRDERADAAVAALELAADDAVRDLAHARAA